MMTMVSWVVVSEHPKKRGWGRKCSRWCGGSGSVKEEKKKSRRRMGVVEHCRHRSTAALAMVMVLAILGKSCASDEDDAADLTSRLSSRPLTSNMIRIKDAGLQDVNGLWHQLLGLHNGVPEFERRVNATKHYEMFLHSSDNGKWWNIQEVFTNPVTRKSKYGKVAYGSSLVTKNPDPASVRWQTWVNNGGRPPRVEDLRMCQSIAECDRGDDVCLDFYIAAFSNLEFQFDVLEHDGGIRTCEDRGHWVRDISDEEIARYRRLFFESGIVSIPNFLRDDVFRELQAELALPLHSQFWQASFVDPKTNDATLVPRSRKNARTIEAMIDLQHQRRQESKYAYSFTRTLSSTPAKYRRFYRHFFGDMRSMLDSLRVQDILSRISDRAYELTVLFVSRYTSGDFLDRHSDSVETRRIAFTFHFTQQWRLEYGGLLLFLNQHNWDEAERVFVPKRNTFTFFDVSEERRILPHMVTEVVAGLERERTAVTGWMQYRGERDKFQYPPSHEWDYDS